ncbi:MAG: ATP-dependent Clp protease adapter ClpS [Acidimicrobiia bacterium]|nr:ATP-dependent Clp protease adapter ClpS [Acidimicrobiia bacterium]
MTSAPAPVRDPVEHDQDLADRPWQVVVWDDPVNLMNYVVFVFREIFGFDKAKATKLMLQVHNEGKATVFSGPREQAEMYVARLHGYGLWATMDR